ncbi:MAG TPA: pseudouridine synthase [Candidatus Binatia bacterium]|nr:pseudouridine synthase [Candidatus Binatia bacterium]
MERLQKIIARAGLASRREAERWIVEGRITVNGTVVNKLGSQADPFKDSIKIDGKRIKAAAAPLYYALHKPPGVITTLNDPQHRPDITPYVARLGEKRRVFPVGRLDFNTTGLLLLTNDGELALRLAHPRYGVPKVYRVKLSACPTEEELNELRKGIRLEDGMTAPARVRVIEKLRKNAWVEIEVHEGKKREVRRMFEALNYFVEKLVRIKIGPINLGGLAVGELRPLYQSEVMALKVAVGLARPGRADAERRPVIAAKKSGGFVSRRSTYTNKPPSSGARNRTPRSR